LYFPVDVITSFDPEWQIVDLAVQAYGLVGVSLYDTLGKDSVGTSTHSDSRQYSSIRLSHRIYVNLQLSSTLSSFRQLFRINHSHLTVIFVTQEHIAALLKLAPKLPTLKLIISIDDLTPQMKNACAAWAETQGLKFQELRDREP
jgi:long-chain acyl-CoA synthetase